MNVLTSRPPVSMVPIGLLSVQVSARLHPTLSLDFHVDSAHFPPRITVLPADTVTILCSPFANYVESKPIFFVLELCFRVSDVMWLPKWSVLFMPSLAVQLGLELIQLGTLPANSLNVRWSSLRTSCWPFPFLIKQHFGIWVRAQMTVSRGVKTHKNPRNPYGLN